MTRVKLCKGVIEMRQCHPNGVQGRRPINAKKRNKKQKEVSDLQRFLKSKLAK